MIKVAMIGFGGIANTAHFPPYKKLEEDGLAQLVAVCDTDEARFKGKTTINIGASDEGLERSFATYTDWREMLTHETVDMVDVCLPTFLHAEVVSAVLSMGYPVLSEKPMASTYADCRKMLDAAKKSGQQLMIGQCLRFSNNYNFLKKAITENTFGKLRTAIFRRFSAPPRWGWQNWYMDIEKSGGALQDLHIHDVDMVRYLLGEPLAVSCDTTDIYSGDDIAYSRMYYKDATVLAIGDWSREGCNFQADFTVSFEKATVVLGKDGITVYPRGGSAYKTDVEGNDFYEAEIRYFVQLLKNGCENTENPPESAAATIKLIETLRKSARSGGEKIPFTV